MEARPFDAITLLGQIALTQPGGVFGVHCPVENQIIVLSANYMGWCIAAES